MKNQTPEENSLSRIRDDYFVFDSQPIFVESQVIGGLVTFKNVSNVRETENQVRRSLAKRFKSKYKIVDFIFRSQTAP